MIEMIMNQFKGLMLNSFIKGDMKVDFDLLSKKNNHLVLVRGLQKHQPVLEEIAKALQKYIQDEIIKCKEPPVAKITTKCFDGMKTHFKVTDRINALKAQYPKIIKSFDVSKRGIIEVDYFKYEAPEDALPDPQNPGWEFVRN